MPKFLIEASYTAEGARGLAKDGCSKRKAFITELTKKSGGTLESFHFAFGGSDVFCVVDLPDNASMMAVSLAVNSSGAVTLKTIPLLTAEEVDAAAKQQVNYRPPGQA